MFNPFNIEESVKAKANRTEKRVARKWQLQQQPNSGAVPGFKGDMKSRKFLFDVKSTDSASIKVDVEMLAKIRREAFGAGKDPVILLVFNKLQNMETEYAVIPMSVFREMEGEE